MRRALVWENSDFSGYGASAPAESCQSPIWMPASRLYLWYTRA
jgi:hypothetical protein